MVIQHRNFAQFEYVVLGALMTILFHLQEPEIFPVRPSNGQWFIPVREQEKTEPELDKLSEFAIRRRRRREKYFRVERVRLRSIIALINGRMM